MKPRHDSEQRARAARVRRNEPVREGRAEEGNRGRTAEKPSDFPKNGWKDILSRTKNELAEDHISIVAAGVAFYVFFGIIPALAALVALYGLVADPGAIQQQLDAMKGVMPPEVIQILDQQMSRIVGQSSGLSWGAALGFLVALWSGAKATKALITALNITYDEKETRSFIRLNLVALGLTLAGIVGILIAIGLVVAIPIALQYVDAGGAAKTAAELLRWPLLAVFAMAGIAAFYRFAPDRDPAKWRWVTWGAGLATLLWLGASALFSFYVSHFGSYNKTYGSLGAVAVLMLWFLLSAYVILLGAELDSEMEHQTAEDTTRDPRKPMGQRDAYVADTVGGARNEKRNEA